MVFIYVYNYRIIMITRNVILYRIIILLFSCILVFFKNYIIIPTLLLYKPETGGTGGKKPSSFRDAPVVRNTDVIHETVIIMP